MVKTYWSETLKRRVTIPEDERVTYDCHRCRSYDLPYWCCPYCHRTLTKSDPDTRALMARMMGAIFMKVGRAPAMMSMSLVVIVHPRFAARHRS